MNIGDRIKQELSSSPEKSQVEAAKFAGLGVSTMSDLVSGRSRSSTKLHLIAEYLGVTASWLETGKPPKYVNKASTDQVSTFDETERHPQFSRVKRLRIEGAVMDDQGFWKQGDTEPQETPYPTDDPDAYAIRILSHEFHPALVSGQCILVSPASPVKPGRPVLLVMTDGRRTLCTYQSHEHGQWNVTSVVDGNRLRAYPDRAVEAVYRVMAYLWTD